MTKLQHTKKTTISEADKSLFRQAVEGTKRLNTPQTIVNVPPRSLPPKPTPQISMTTPETELSPLTENIRPQQSLLFVTAGVQTRVIRKLKRGQISPQETLDLHGYTRQQANILLQQFLQQSTQMDYRCVCIIHGKGLSTNSGQAIIKSSVNQWLRQYPCVLAFCSAPPRQGGTGAVLVLLRKGGSN